jgi:hypothetical protein
MTMTPTHISCFQSKFFPFLIKSVGRYEENGTILHLSKKLTYFNCEFFPLRSPTAFLGLTYPYGLIIPQSCKRIWILNTRAKSAETKFNGKILAHILAAMLYSNSNTGQETIQQYTAIYDLPVFLWTSVQPKNCIRPYPFLSTKIWGTSLDEKRTELDTKSRFGSYVYNQVLKLYEM